MVTSNPPFPGAQLNPMLLLGYLYQDISAPGYFTLTGKQAVTYATATPVTPITLGPGDKLYRVYGGPAAMAGGFWAPVAPAAGTSQGEWRSSNAVEPSWNAGTNVVELTVKAGHSLQSWTGKIESQPALDNENERIDDWWLVGGGDQYFCQFWTNQFKDAVTLTDLGGTPWSGPRDVDLSSDYVSLNVGHSDLDASNPQQAHVLALGELGDLLRQAANSGKSESNKALEQAANNIFLSAKQMLHIAQDDAEAIAKTARGDLKLGRVLDIDPAESGTQALESALDAVVHSAAVLTGRIG